MNPVTVDDIPIGTHAPLVIIAGPCVIEDRDTLHQTADTLKSLCAQFRLPLIFKCSYEKDNRSSIRSYTGPGLKKGLSLLAGVKERFAIPVTADVHRPEDMQAASEVLDLIQIPAFLCQQTSLLLAAGRSGKAVNIKKGQFMSAGRMEGPRAKVTSTGNENVLITERGTTFGDASLISDMRTLVRIQQLGCPVIFDASHLTRLFESAKYGEPEHIPALVRAAVATGCDGIFVETHPEPRRAKSDAGTMAKLSDMEEILRQAAEIGRLVRSWTSK